MGELDQLHKVLLQIMLEIDRICSTYNIEYSLAYGTLIGAVRHKGFIPWDDDMDIIMTRKNYERFMAVCRRDLGGEYFLQSKESEKGYPYNSARIRKNDTAFIIPQWKESGLHQGIFVDIIPCDDIPDKRFIWDIERVLLMVLATVRRTGNKALFITDRNGNTSKKRVVLYNVCRILPVRLCGKLEHCLIRSNNGKGRRRTGFICEGNALLRMNSSVRPFKSKYMEEYTTVEFCGREFMAVTNYKTLLKEWYGDYMKLPPVHERRVYHRPLVMDCGKAYTEYQKGKEQ